jgi:hypothetical protein
LRIVVASELDEIEVSYADLLQFQRALSNGQGFVEAHDIALSYQALSAVPRRSALDRQLDAALQRVNGYIAEYATEEETDDAAPAE